MTECEIDSLIKRLNSILILRLSDQVQDQFFDQVTEYEIVSSIEQPSARLMSNPATEFEIVTMVVLMWCSVWRYIT